MLTFSLRKSIVAAAAAAIFGTLALVAGTATAQVINTDLKLSALSAVQIINQQTARFMTTAALL